MDFKNDYSPFLMGIDEQEIKMIELIGNGLNNQKVNEVLKLGRQKLILYKQASLKMKIKNPASLVLFEYN
ncbi:LuxR family transcriptional regulator [Pedobacter agri]|uniref:LuxR family transcriptional regulator n=1 Tax=Pedobacter agri TaxID=454586 RepID=UPI00292FCB69|nr:LuxR family transcriptional regulator [Pedobacter agri]